MSASSVDKSPARRTRRSPWRLLILGSVLGIVATTWFALTAVFVMRAEKAPGVLTRLEQRDDSSMWDATFTFTDSAAASHIVKMSYLGLACPSHRPGDPLSVLYEPSAPQEARIDELVPLWFGPLLVGALSLGFCAGAGLVSVGLRTLARRPQQPAAT